MTVDFSARHGVTLEFLEVVEAVQANQGNAETLLTMLDLWDPTGPDGPWWGQCPAGEFLERALIAASPTRTPDPRLRRRPLAHRRLGRRAHRDAPHRARRPRPHRHRGRPGRGHHLELTRPSGARPPRAGPRRYGRLTARRHSRFPPPPPQRRSRRLPSQHFLLVLSVPALETAMTDLPDTDAPTVVRLSAPEDLVAALPSLLGFVPTRSLVAIAMLTREGRTRLGGMARIDLPGPGGTRGVRRRRRRTARGLRPVVGAARRDHRLRRGRAPRSAGPGIVRPATVGSRGTRRALRRRTSVGMFRAGFAAAAIETRRRCGPRGSQRARRGAASTSAPAQGRSPTPPHRRLPPRTP